MASEQTRRNTATATTGAALLASGGVLRHHAVRRAYPDVRHQPRVHALAMLRRAPKGKKQFWVGSTVGALGLPPLAVGTTRLIRGDVNKGLKVARTTPVVLDRARGYARIGNQVGHAGGITDDFYRRAEKVQQSRQGGLNRALGSYTSGSVSHYRPVASRKRTYAAGATLGAGLVAIPKRKVEKRDQDKRGFWREGLSGTREALGERASSYRDPVPAKLRAAQAGVGAGVGALGSLAARAALGRRGNALKPVLTPVAGGLAATASVPLSNKVISRRHPEYEVTAAGVRRKKTPIKMPSSAASRHRPLPRSFRQDVTKSAHDDAMSRSYQGSRTPYIRQRAAITAAGHPPVIGPFTAAAAAARYAPPGQERKQAVRQWAMGSGAGLPIGVGGAYAGAHLTSHSSTAEGIANDALKVKHQVHQGARKLVGLKPKPEKGPGKLTTHFLASRAGKPFRTKAGAVGGAAGFIGAKMASGGVLGQTAISLNQRDQRRYNKAHHIEKAAGPGQTKRERHQLATRKRRSAALSTISGVAGLGSLTLLATGHRHPAVTLGTIGAGVGGTNSLLGARVQRQEARAVDPVKKIAPRVVYHGTTEAGAKGILKEGFRPAHRATYGPGAYTGDKKLATKWARRRGGRKGHVVRVVAVGPVRAEGAHPSGGTFHLWDPTHISPVDIHQKPGLHPAVKVGISAGAAGTAGGGGYAVYQHNHRTVAKRIPRNQLEAAAAWHTKLHQISDTLVAVPKPHRRVAAGALRSLAANPTPLLTVGSKAVLRKSAALEIKGSRKEHHEMLHRYGDRGPLPKGLDRDTRMKAWEARYVHHGGQKQNKYARRAEIGEGIKNAGLAVATTGGAAWLAARHKRGAALVRRHPHLARHAETTAVAGATVGGAGEMLAGWAHHRQASYANSPGGVAASALRRMRDNTPEPS